MSRPRWPFLAAGAVTMAGVGLLLVARPAQQMCVARGTLIATPEGKIPVEDLEVGSLIYSVDVQTKKLVLTTVVAIESAAREVGSLEVGDRRLLLTSDHPVYCPVSGSYHSAGAWFLRQRRDVTFFDEAITAATVTRAEPHVGVRSVFDLTVDSSHRNFIANGVIVHNKSRPPIEPAPYVCVDAPDCTSDCVADAVRHAAQARALLNSTEPGSRYRALQSMKIAVALIEKHRLQAPELEGVAEEFESVKSQFRVEMEKLRLDVHRARKRKQTKKMKELLHTMRELSPDPCSYYYQRASDSLKD